jgi:ketopantoate reductase
MKVALISRGVGPAGVGVRAQLEAIRARGLSVKSPTMGDFTVSGFATEDPREVGPVDLVLVAVKTYDLCAAAAQLQPLIGPETASNVDIRNHIQGTGDELQLPERLDGTGRAARRTSRSPVLDSQDGIPTTELASCASGAITG